MKRADVRTYCLAKPGAWIDQPWEGDEVVKDSPRLTGRGKIWPR